MHHDRSDYLDAQYNPTRVNVPEFPGILGEWAARSAQARGLYECKLDVAYGSDVMETLDIFPAIGPCHALMAFFHGGYWSFADKGDFSFLAPTFVERGIAFASINYELAPKATLETIVSQSQSAMAFLHRNAADFGIPRERLYVSGHSAGGHIVGMLMTTDWRARDPALPADLVKGGLSISGLHDLEPFVHADFIKPVLGLDAARAKALSPIHARPATGAPLHTAVGAEEKEEFLRQSKALNEAWPDVCRSALVVAGANHFNIFDALIDPGSALFAATFALMEAPISIGNGGRRT